MDSLETKIPPVVLWAVSVGLIWVLRNVDSVLDLDILRLLGFALIVAGLGGATLGVASFFKAKTTVDPHHIDKASTLVTDGVYRVTRNPMYLGLLTLLVAWGLIAGSLVAAIVGVVFFVVVMTRLQIGPEERMLEQKFGDAYATYRRRTRRWL